MLTASETAAAIREDRTTSVAVLDELIRRIETYNPNLNAIVTLDLDGARRRAREADVAHAEGRTWGPLHGVPITIKDAFETAGMRTVCGYPGFSDHVPTEDAQAVARLRRAGAIILGKTNVPPLASGIQSNNPVFGRTSNPWDLGRTPGGSSGGAAAAIAAGLSYLELGSDIGGSIRIPAHFCGVYGLKATSGRIPGKGHLSSPKPLALPAGWAPLLQLASFGPIARSIDDLRMALTVLAGRPDPSPAAEPARPLSALRIAWTDTFGGVPLTEGSRRAIRAFIAALEAAGCRVARRDSAGFDVEDAWQLAGTCLGAINTRFQSALTQRLRRLSAPLLARLGPHDALMQGLYAGAAADTRRVHEALVRREALIGKLEAFLGDWDAWVVPVFPGPAFTHRSPKAPIEVDDGSLTQLQANLLHSILFNLTGSPVVVMPVGRSAQRLPIGVQVVGRRGQDMDLLDVAARLAEVTPGYQVPPGYAVGFDEGEALGALTREDGR